MHDERDPPALRRPIPQDAVDLDAAKVIGRLTRHGFQAYLVGGCVRDLLLGRRPKDFDIATSARPRQVKRLFRNSRIIGRRFRLVHVRFGPRIVEVATFRAPPDQDGDDPYITRDNVFGDERSDAFRRDFTMNGLFYDLQKGRVIDHVGGLEDLERRAVRTIGEADLRLREDPVRILRAAKFAGRLDLTLTPDLHEAARAHAGDLAKAAPPRVLEEIYRMLSGNGPAQAFRILQEVGALEVLLPEIAPPPEEFFAALDRMEEWGQGDRDRVPQSLMIAVLLSPHLKRVLGGDVGHDHEAAVQDALKPVADRLTVARRDQTRARQCFAAQLRFAEPPLTRGAKRFCLRDYFEEAMLLRRFVGPVGEDGNGDAFRLWEELGQETRGGHEQPRRRRRRRRRRRGRRGKVDSCPPPSGSSSAPAPGTPPSESPKGS